MTRSQLNEEISDLSGGKAAEDLVLNEVSTGASSDLKACKYCGSQHGCQIWYEQPY